jgi:hypothetical protein
MNEKSVCAVWVDLKSHDPLFLFQFTRSSDKRIVKAKLNLDKYGKPEETKSLVSLVEYNLETEKEDVNRLFTDDALTDFFTFTKPILSDKEPGVYSTSCEALPGRVIKLHTLNSRYFMTTTIEGVNDACILASHTTIDTPKIGYPLLRGIQIYGRNKAKEKFVTESLPIAKYMKKFISMMMEPEGR